MVEDITDTQLKGYLAVTETFKRAYFAFGALKRHLRASC
jgi:hypothetical protein